MEDFAIIIPDRCDRPDFLEHCLYQMSRQTLMPACKYLINYKPGSQIFDLAERIRRGIDNAIKDGIDIVYIIENDDYYPDDYFEKNWIQDYDFVGIPFTHYYHILTGGHRLSEHTTYSSLFCTGFRINSLDKFSWPIYIGINLDIILWNYARSNCNCYFLLNPALPIGIKHGQGRCAGIGHNPSLYTDIDKSNTWLKSIVRPESFDFYMSIKKKYAQGTN